MNLSALETFLIIVETGSLVRASERLNVTQSTVTMRLKTLEEEIGQTLLTRHKTGATLTASGVKLRQYARVMVDLWKQARQETSLPVGVTARISFGCTPRLWDPYGRKFLSDLRCGDSGLAVSVLHGSAIELTQGLRSGLVDLAITATPTRHADQVIHTLAVEPLILVSPAPNTPMRADPNYIYVDHDEVFAQEHAAEYSDAGTARFSFTNAAWALDHMLEFGGSAYLPETMVTGLISSGKLHQTQGAPVFERRIFIVASERATDLIPT